VAPYFATAGALLSATGLVADNLSAVAETDPADRIHGVRLSDVATGASRGEVRTPALALFVSPSDDGRRMLVTAGDSAGSTRDTLRQTFVRLVDVATVAAIGDDLWLPARVQRNAISADGQTVALLLGDGSALVIDADDMDLDHLVEQACALVGHASVDAVRDQLTNRALGETCSDRTGG
jgi:hypothetical protein